MVGAEMYRDDAEFTAFCVAMKDRPMGHIPIQVRWPGVPPSTSSPVSFEAKCERYRRWLQQLSWGEFIRLRNGSWSPDTTMFGMIHEERWAVWREVYDARTLLRPAFAGPMTNKDLLVAV